MTIGYSVLRYFLKNYFYFVLGLFIANKKLNNKYDNYNILKILVFIIIFILIETFKLNILLSVEAVLGINIVLSFSKRLENCKLLSTLGIKSMEIYLLHGPCMIILRTLFLKIGMSKIIIPVGLFAGSLTASLCIGYIINLIPFLRTICFGDNKG